MKPTEQGNYWVRQNYKHCVSGTIMAGAEEIVQVILSYPSHTRNLNKPKVMMVFGRFWHNRLDEIPHYWQWGKKIENDLPIFIDTSL